MQDSLTVGAIFSPAACGGGGPGGGGPGLGGAIPGLGGGMSVQPIDGPGQIPFQPGTQFLAAWNAHWMQQGAGLNIGTPMQEAFDRADSAIQGSTLNGQLAVVAFTTPAELLPGGGRDDRPEPERAASWLMNKQSRLRRRPPGRAGSPDPEQRRGQRRHDRVILPAIQPRSR